MHEKIELQEFLKFDDTSPIINYLQNTPSETWLDCSSYNLNTAGLGHIAETLLLYPSITSLSLRYCQMNDETLGMLLRNPSIKSLDMKFPLQDMDTVTLQAYTKLVKETTWITSFDFLIRSLALLDDEKLASEGIQALIEAIKCNKSITEIDYCYNGYHSISDKFFIMLVEIIRENTFINKLDLNGYSEFGLKSIWIEIVARAIENNKSITEFFLAECDIDDKCAQALAQVIKNNPYIAGLNLHYSNISVEGIKMLAQAIEENMAITSLSLAGNHIDDEGTKALAQAITENKFLKSVNLYYNDISDEGAEALAQAIKENTSITKLDLSKNNISQEGINAVVNALEKNCTITQLDCEQQGVDFDLEHVIPSELETKLFELLARNKHYSTQPFVDIPNTESIGSNISPHGSSAKNESPEDSFGLTVTSIHNDFRKAQNSALGAGNFHLEIIQDSIDRNESIDLAKITDTPEKEQNESDNLVEKRFDKTKVANAPDGLFYPNKGSKRPVELESLDEGSASKKQKINE